MRIVFIGAVESSKAALSKLLKLKADVVGVLAPAKSDFNSDFCDLSLVAKSGGIPFKAVKNINDPENLAWLRKLSPDIIFCFGFSQLLKTDLLHSAPMGVVGFHPALLPHNRGRHPIVWALALGLKNTGSTFFFMDEGADSGKILSQKKVTVIYTDTARTLYDRIIKTSLGQIEDFLPKLQKGTFRAVPQRSSLANYWRKRGPEDGRIDFRMTSRCIYNLVRALSRPYVGAHLLFRGAEVKVWEAREVSYKPANIECGKVIRSGRSGLLVKCAGGAILLAKHEFAHIPEAGEYIV
ncbi:MAG: formyltransferase family protein [Elusimicrobiota bacterium]|nr:formyltransferase family protein [Elusimicrobiota bacterium]